MSASGTSMTVSSEVAKDGLEPKNVIAIGPESEKPGTSAVPAPPDGGLLAWSQVLAAFFLFFNSWGLVNSFGAYQTYYDATISRSPSEISWIGTFQGFVMVMFGILIGPLYDLGYFRELIIVGNFLVTFGMMMTSLGTEYYQLFLAQGLVVGLGAGCLFIPSVAVAAQYFTTKRALAVGITASGGSIGGLLYPIIFRHLQPAVGFGWATRVIAFIAFGTLLFSLALIRPRVRKAAHKRALLDLYAFRDPAFIVFGFAMFLAFVGLYFPFFYVAAWAETQLGTKPDTAFYLLSILNAGSVFGRIIPGLIADHLGSLNVIIPSALITAVLGFAWLGVSNLGGLIVWAVLYGFFSGACVSLLPTILAGIAPDMGRIGTWMGMSFIFVALGLLIGNPIAGAILDSKGGSFVGAQCFSAACSLGGAVLQCGLRWIKFRSGKGWKV